MTNELRTLALRYEGAANVLALLMENDASAAELEEQKKHCRGLRALMNSLCPDSQIEKECYTVNFIG